ncbi:MAG TPA: hypothetical protein PLR25_24010 [Planctomycetaceae bacterium]|nr:hypothetical protein [Planctomycetaceae bacterium]
MTEQSASGFGTSSVPWYRRNLWVTVMVAGIIFVGPILALPVLVILCTGNVYNKDEAKPWDSSTKWLVLLFSLLVFGIWCYQAYQMLLGEAPE